MEIHATEQGAQSGSQPGVGAVPSLPTERELAILRRVLGAVAVPGVEQLVEQLRMLRVSPVSDATCRIYLVHPDAPRSRFARGERRALPPRFPVHSPAGRVVGEIAVWVQQGYLCALQYVAHGPNEAMVLPAPERIVVPSREVPAEVRVRSGRQALAGVQALGVDPVRAPTTPTDAARHRMPSARRVAGARRLHPLLAALALLVAGLAGAAFMATYSRGADVAAARQAGATAGAALGAEHGEVAGRFAGDVEGRRAGRSATYPSAFVAARDRERARMRRQAAERRRAAEVAGAAAAAAPVPVAAPAVAPDNTTCPGYRDARGYWICT